MLFDDDILKVWVFLMFPYTISQRNILTYRPTWIPMSFLDKLE